MATVIRNRAKTEYSERTLKILEVMPMVTRTLPIATHLRRMSHPNLFSNSLSIRFKRSG